VQDESLGTYSGNPVGHKYGFAEQPAGVDVGVDAEATGDWAAGARAIVESLPSAALIVDGDGRVFACNAAAAVIIAESTLFIDVFGRLRTGIPALQRRLGALLAGSGPRRGVLRIVDYGAGGDILLTVSPIACDGAQNGPMGRLALLCLACETTCGSVLVKVLCDVYGLTRDEALVAVAIYHGQRTTDFALCHGLDVLSACALREAVMLRLGAHRAADVARRVAMVSHMVPVGGPCVRTD